MESSFLVPDCVPLRTISRLKRERGTGSRVREGGKEAERERREVEERKGWDKERGCGGKFGLSLKE